MPPFRICPWKLPSFSPSEMYGLRAASSSAGMEGTFTAFLMVPFTR